LIMFTCVVILMGRGADWNILLLLSFMAGSVIFADLVYSALFVAIYYALLHKYLIG
jgi:hypothetical protein